MARIKTDDVLADLKRVGAVGAPPPAPVPVVVEVEKRVPEPTPADAQRAEAVETVDVAIEALDGVVRGLEELREALVHLRKVWAPGEEAPVAAPEPPLSASEASEGPPVPQEPPSPPEAPQEPDEETLARAREAARRKILGEDLTPEQREAVQDDEDDVPFVGQVRALPVGQEPEEITIGTVGTIKPSFPAEE